MSYNAPPPPPAAPYGGGQMPAGDHPQATTILVLGILSLVVCTPLGIVGMIMGKSALREIEASGGTLGGHGQVKAGWICSLIAVIFLAIAVVVLLIVLAAGGFAASS